MTDKDKIIVRVGFGDHNKFVIPAQHYKQVCDYLRQLAKAGEEGQEGSATNERKFRVTNK